MLVVTCAHTADVPAPLLAQARAMLADAFEGDFGDDDWEHGLGGMHAVAWDGPEQNELIGHASVVQRRMVQGGRALRCGYVEGVCVRADWRRRGAGGALMAPLERIVRAAYDVGALASTQDGAPLYSSRGWQQWRGSNWALSPGGRVRTPDEEGWIFIFPGALPLEALDLTGELTCDWRDGDVW